MFPETYTPFLKKNNASYAGDPKGDYILAEHINELQDAISALERNIGLQPKKSQTIVERVRAIEGLTPLQVPSFHWYSSGIPTEVDKAKNSLSRFETVILSERTASLPSLLEERDPLSVYGAINAQNPLALLQTEAAEWRNAGAGGILLTDFGMVATRTQEQAILNSLSERGLRVLLQTNQPTRLFSKSAQPGYNPQGNPLTFPEGSLLLLEHFAFDQRVYTTEELMLSIYPLLLEARNQGVGLVGQGQTRDEKSHHYFQTAGLLFALDGLLDGPVGGTPFEDTPPVYSWNAPLVNWKTGKPAIQQEAGRLTRTLPGGLVGLQDPGEMILKGPVLDSILLDWIPKSVPGDALKNRSIHPEKLSGYDIKWIVDLLNASGDDIQIDLTKIKMSGGSGGLPASIPAENMIQNVIEAINRKANPLSANKNTIEDAAIQSIDAGKLTGDIERQRFEKFVIAAVNATSTTENYLKQERIDTVALNSTGTIDGNRILSDTFQARMIDARESITTVDLTTSGYHTGHSGEYQRLIVDWLTAYKLDGLKELHVETLTADNIGTLVLKAIDAEIENGRFNNIVTKALTAETIQADLVTALNAVVGSQITNDALIGDAVITDAKIKDLSVTKLKSGVINTALINLSSPDGHLKIEDKTIRIYDNVDEEGIRRLRVILGATKEVTQDENYGLVVLGPDGTTRLYDHTGVYNAGIHPNAISEEKLQDDSISERVIRAGAVYTKHLDAEAVTAEKIAADAILAKHILAGEITGDKIAGQTITGAQIKGGTIEGGHIKAGSITSEALKAHSITSDKLTVGFTQNLIRDGYASFEQEPVGTFDGIPIAGTTMGQITREWSWDGRNSLSIMGNDPSNRIQLSKSDLDYTIPVMPGRTYFVSAWAHTESTNNVPVVLGLAYNKDSQKAISSILAITKADRVKRLWAKFTVPEGMLRAALIIGVETTNAKVFFDCLQVEEAEEGQTEPGFWKATATTKINGASIETGYVGAEHIHIGGGTIFGANNDIIDITDEGIKAKSKIGYAMMNSKGLEISGGAFLLKGGIDGNNVEIDGKQGMTIDNNLNRIELDAAEGFRIINKAAQQIILDIDPTTGNLRFSGTARFYSNKNPEMAWSLEEKLEEIDQDLSDMQDQVDGSIESWFGDVEPTLRNYPARDWSTNVQKESHLGDLYYDNLTGYTYRFTKTDITYHWLLIKDTDITAALQAAQKAQESSDEKRRVFVTTPNPPYDIGDLWTQGNAGELLRAKTPRTASSSFQQSDWEKAVKYTDDTKANEAIQEAEKAKENLNNFVEVKDRQRSVRLGMRMGYRDFRNTQANWLYFCKLRTSPDDFREELVDENGSIYDYTTQIEVPVPKQALDLTGVPVGEAGYLVFDMKVSLVWFISYQKEFTEKVNPTTGVVEKIPSREYWLRWNPGKTGHNTALPLDESIYIIGEIER